MKEQILEEIKRMCGEALMLDNGWCHFVFRNIHYVYIPNDNNELIRITIPHIVNGADYKRETIEKVINETNREVKYVKAMLLSNGSISLDYDHKLCNEEKTDEIVEHMIMTLYASADYLKRKVKKNR